MAQALHSPMPESQIHTRLDLAKYCLQQLLADKLILNPKHELALMIVNTEETNNVLADESSYQHIFQLPMHGSVSFVRPSVDTVKIINELQTTQCSKADLLESLQLAVHNICSFTGKKKYTKRIYVFTDGECKLNTELRVLNDIISSTAKNEIKMNFICIDLLDAGNYSEDPRSINQKISADVLNNMSESDHINVVSSQDSYEIIRSFKKKSKATRSLGKSILKVGALSIDINSFKKTRVEKLPTFSKQNKHTGNKIAIERKYYESEALNAFKEKQKEQNEQNENYVENENNAESNDLVEIPLEEREKCYLYGQQIFKPDDNMNSFLNVERIKGFEVFASVDLNTVPKRDIVGDVMIMSPVDAKNSKSMTQVFKALVRVCVTQNRGLYCRYIRTSKSSPKLVLLWPKIKTSNELHLFYTLKVPYLDKVMDINFEVKYTPKADEAQMVDSLIEKMSLIDKSGDEPEEVIKPKETYYPSLQLLIATLNKRIISSDPNSKMEMPKEIEDLYDPKFEFIDYTDVDNLCKLIKDKMKIKKNEKKGKEQVRFWSDIAYLQEMEEVLKAKDFDNGVDKDQDWNDFDNVNSLNPEDPIAHFYAMVKDTKTDRTDKALQLMLQYIDKLLENVGLNSELLYNCIRTVKVVCINEDEYQVFNDFYRGFKEKYEQTDLWTLLKSKKVGLISNAESISSDVTLVQSLNWLMGVDGDDDIEGTVDGGTETDSSSDE